MKRTTTKVGRFGISCQRGPSNPPIAATVESLYGVDPAFTTNLGIAAIVYMFVEPDYRGRNIGTLALEMISFIQATTLQTDFILLVADDKSQQKQARQQQSLARWYEKHGYQRAPLLQDMMGSPNEQYGISMIAPTNGTRIPGGEQGCRIEWW